MNVITALRSSDFLRNNTIFFAGSVLVGALNYLYYPLIGRLVSPAVFGEIQTLVSLFLQFTIFLNVLGMITVNIMANYADKEKAIARKLQLSKDRIVNIKISSVGVLNLIRLNMPSNS